MSGDEMRRNLLRLGSGTSIRPETNM